MKKLKKYLLLFAMISFAISCGDDNNNTPVDPDDPVVADPVITSITPTEVFAKEIFTISGKNFTKTKGKVFFSATKEAEVVTWSDTLITAKLDTEPGKYPIFVKVNEKESNKMPITIKEPPVEEKVQIFSITPNQASVGDTIIISGKTFGEERNLNDVHFGENIAASSDYVSWADDMIVCIVPIGLKTGKYDVFVSKENEISNKVSFTIIEKQLNPVITELLPKGELEVGTQVTIIGNDFGTEQAQNSYLMLNDTKITNVVSWVNDMIKFIIPENSITGKLYVVAKDAKSNAVDIIIKEEVVTNDDPIIESLSTYELSPNSGIEIKGKNFGENIGKIYLANKLQITNENIQKWRPESIRILLPPSGLKAGQLYIVTADGKASNKVDYSIKIYDKIKMVLIKAGSFTMGDNSSEEPSEKPEHKVNITKDYYVSETEITQRQYKDCIPQNAFVPKNVDNSPANNITFIDACRFCNLLSEATNLEVCYKITENKVEWIKNANGYRLLTEAEWEYAARAGKDNKWGFDGNFKDYGWSRENAGASSQPFIVKQKKPNAWGLYDMNGNVAEWVWDAYSWEYYGQSDNANDPKGPSEWSNYRIIRGGSFEADTDKCKATSKNSLNITQRSYTLGFRIARTR